MSFEDKVVFITGGAIGFGRAFAQAFAGKGASVVIADIDTEQAELTVRSLRSRRGQGVGRPLRVADEAEVVQRLPTPRRT